MYAHLTLKSRLLPGEVETICYNNREVDMSTTNEASPHVPYDVGHEVEDFSLPLIDGGMGSFSDYRGKVVVLVFVATWCPYCGAEAPFLEQEVWRKYKNRNVQVLVVDVKEPAELIKKFRDQYGWTFPVMLDQTAAVALKFALPKEGLPPEVAIINSHFIIDQRRVVRYRQYLDMEKFDARARNIVAELEKLLP
jgi:peroxiredoxin